ncbi:MAG TPA: metallophosphoesterase [Candidatus Aminicenantes bacterium]|nr:metallophosphoesterase [Candidatus Aminicenantes bacterium]HRY65644.1 metallophosphoesterase [Candidatus Aminicenantes bacterium]HRZ72468.1 metallophosphoesterase [Candidatus Aminicenantes bacterium]
MFRRRKGRPELRPFLSGLALALALLVRPAPADEIPYQWTGVDRVVAVADLHGDYDRFVFILAHPQIGLVDASLHWIGGRTHLVQLGDVLDRGPRAKDILDLIRRLQGEAAEAGGAVHMLLGNHEEMNITGIVLDYPDYVPVEQFVAFLPADFRRKREAEFLRTLPAEERRKAEIEGLDIYADEDLAGFWHKALTARDPEARRAYILGFNKACGDWLVRQNSVIKIDDIVYVHGGISEAVSKWPLREINQVIRTELQFFQGRMRNPQDYGKPFHPRLVYDPDSPLWFRGLATKSEAAAQAEIDRTLANLGARAMVIGHNYFRFNHGSSAVVEKSRVTRFQDKVWIMDTGISGSYGGIPSALVYERGEFKVWGETEEVAARSGIRPPPPRPLSPREMETFLRTAAVTGRGPGVGGRTDAWRLTLESEGFSRPALFKYIDRRRPDSLADSWRYDLAAYALSTYLDIEAVPPIVERTVEGVAGAVQAFVSGARSLAERREAGIEPRDRQAFERALADLTVFQALVNDDCRRDKDTLVREGDERIYRVDFSEAFAPDKGEGSGCQVRSCSRALYSRLQAWDGKAVAAYLSPYLGREEIEALNARRTLLIRKIRSLIRTLGEARVLF